MLAGNIYFQNVAANPYTELEPDKQTGDLGQILYAIYDFGFGPNVISDIKIGDTPIDEFSDVSYRIVDINKPLTDEGVWDSTSFKEFIHYKGDVESENVGVVVNGNLNDGDDADEYQVIRNASTNSGGDSQEITANFVAPNGLKSFATNGDSGTTSIELTVDFAEVGTENWHEFNNASYVLNSSVISSG